VSFEDVLTANQAYAEAFPHAGLPGAGARHLAVVTCMDVRIDPLAALGLAVGDANVLRNPGGQVTDEVLVSLVLATSLLGVERVLVVQHTGCKMASVSNEQAHAALDEATGTDTSALDLHVIGDQREALRADVERVRTNPHLPSGLPVMGCLYDVDTGRLEVVVD
jgi:carbonic anhydrase